MISSIGRNVTNSSNKPKTITVDIFDTILMRKVWPEGLQFLESAKRSVQIFQKEINPSITPYEIYSWREYVRTEFLSAKRQKAKSHHDIDLTLDEWFSELYTVLNEKYKATSSPISQKLLKALIDIEIGVEQEFTKPNKKLISLLREKKLQNPTLKIYFVSDMYLTSEQVKSLLEYHNILDLFDGGITSTDAQSTKHSGKLYHYLHTAEDTFSTIKLSTTLHIGDNLHADVKMAKKAGAMAIHYKPRRLRRLRTLSGRIKLKLIKLQAYRAEDREYIKSIRSSRNITSSQRRLMHDLGFLFSQPLAVYLLHVGLQARLIPEKHYLFVSSEAGTFIEAGKSLFGSLYNKPQSAIKLNRKRTIHAVAWTIIQRKDSQLTAKLVKVIRYGEVKQGRKEVYNFLLTNSYKVNETELEQLSEKGFLKKLYTDLQDGSNLKYMDHLKEDYEYVNSTLPSDRKTVVICDVGWGGTVQAVYTIFAELHGYKGNIEGLYLGAHPPTHSGVGSIPMKGYLLPNVHSQEYRPYWSAVIWEYVYTNKFQFEGDEERLGFVRQGLSQGYEHFRNIHVNPTDYFNKVIRKKIKRLLRHPSDAEVDSLGEIRYDFGFNNPEILRIVDTDYPRVKFWLNLITKPKATLSIVIAPNNWTGGYIKRFRLFGVPTLLKIAGKIKHTNYL